MKNLYESRLNFLGISLDLNLTLSYRININMIETYYCVMYKEIAIAATDKNCMTAVEILEEQEEGHYQMPIVFLDFYDKDLAKDAVISDSFYGMYLMTEYLIENGHEKLAFVGSIHATSSILDRYCGSSKTIGDGEMWLNATFLRPQWFAQCSGSR